MIRILPFAISLFILSGCHYINEKAGLPDDNPIEEAAEAIVNDRIGLDLDFTPNTPEE